MIISKKVEFSASHICRSEHLSDEENERLYGAASNPLGHGHNYIVEVAVSGDPEPVTGMILEVEPFDRVVPTVENIAIDIWNRLEPHIDPTGRARLWSVRVHETNDLFVEYRGEK